VYFIGYPSGFPNDVFSHVLEVDLTNFGVVMNDNSLDPVDDGLNGISKDFASLLDEEQFTDFTITTDRDVQEEEDSQELGDSQITDIAEYSERPSIRCHSLILHARWAHFKRIMDAKMSEFHTRQLYLPEPYSVVRALITFFYTDHLSSSSTPVIARLLVLANLYNISRLRALSLGKLLRNLTIEHAPTVWAAAREADERGLERRAGKVCFENWGEIVRTESFRSMRREDVFELCGLVGRGAKVVDPSYIESEMGSESEIEEQEDKEVLDDDGTENEEMEP